MSWDKPLIALSAICSIAASVTTIAVYSQMKVATALVKASLQGRPQETVRGPLISVVIPTWNEELYLEHLLQSLAGQSYEPLEVIVADWNSTDSTRQIAEAYGCQVVPVAEKGVGPARNWGAAEARGDFLLFLDADTILEPELVAKLMTAMLNTNACLVHPRVFYYENGFRKYMKYLSTYMVSHKYTTRCVLIRRQVFELIGGYKNIWREDAEIAKDVLSLYGEGSVLYVAHALCATSTRRERLIKMGKLDVVRSPDFPAARGDMVYYRD